MVLSEESSSCFFKSNELHGFVDNSNPVTFSRIIHGKDPGNDLYMNQHSKYEILSDPILDYISRYLLEEDTDENISGYQEEALRVVEKPLYDIVGELYPHSKENQMPSIQSKQNCNFTNCIPNERAGPSSSESLKQHSSIETMLATEFQRGVEEGRKFLPNLKQLSISSRVSKPSLDMMKKCNNNSPEFRLAEEKGSVLLKSKGKKNTNDEDLELLLGRKCKILMLSNEETIRDEMFDKVLLYQGVKYTREDISSLREIMELEANSYSENQNQHGQINLKTLLISCAEAISMNDNKIASELIKQIRKQASPIGDGLQRLACILADGLEARLAGTGSAAYRRYVTRRVSTADYLKTFHMGIQAAPLMRVSYHFANESILSATGDASKIHVIDFGITFGFQWPSLIQALARKKGRPPKLRITGVDLPQPGFHPFERIKETGRRLEDYAQSFGVPFEYKGIASQWESICIDDLSINDDEVLIVNDVYSLSRVRDEPLLGRNSTRNKLFDLIRESKPKVFIQGVFNFSFTPFFRTRFRNVLLQYFRFFDLLDAFIPRNYKQRQVAERDLLGPAIINQIACEGSDLVFRPATYKEWHARNLQAGFEQLPVNPSLVRECTGIIRNGYSDEFFIEEDFNWLLQVWKGNIFYAVSLWKPKVE